ncbi:hypothetical protein NL676_001982 [Syzygium grande]|nr:hypothetical protein NL676_001982 [Syzygium grande]
MYSFEGRILICETVHRTSRALPRLGVASTLHAAAAAARSSVAELVMDTSNPAVFVNAELLGRYVGRKVRAVIQVIRNDGTAVIGKSTDEKQMIVKGLPPSQLTTFVEVIGIADGQNSITADKWTNFGDNFDTFTYNKLCQLANGEYQHLFL